MIIQSSNLNLSSTRSYTQNTYKASSVSVFTTQKEPLNNDATETKGSGNRFMDLVNQYHSTQKTSFATTAERVDALEEMRKQMMNYLLRLLFGDRCNADMSDLDSTNANAEIAPDSYVMQTTRYETQFVYTEQETTSFSTSGTVLTSDGRSLDVNLNLIMSRSFREATSEIIDYTKPVLCDPLVINLDGNPTTVSDQTFFFDLDCDGSKEELSMLNAGNGYLALDKNGDGTINDGSELFGTKSGNGFADLAAYDDDGNGWIDEADEIFSKLKIWTIDADGNSKLVGLGKAGVGAIYLGSSSTDFSLNNVSNETNAVIRRTGLFLYESGAVGSVQQVDLAIHKPLEITA